jgi:hypothetical protein
VRQVGKSNLLSVDDGDGEKLNEEYEAKNIMDFIKRKERP